eukprot:s1033_g8.t1
MPSTHSPASSRSGAADSVWSSRNEWRRFSRLLRFTSTCPQEHVCWSGADWSATDLRRIAGCYVSHRLAQRSTFAEWRQLALRGNGSFVRLLGLWLRSRELRRPPVVPVSWGHMSSGMLSARSDLRDR